MKGMLDKVYERTWDENMESIEDCIVEECLTYENMGRLMTELLEFFGGKYDDKAMKLLVSMMQDYIDETM